MRLSIRFNNKWIVVPCGGGENSIEWLIEETLQRINDKTHAPQNYEAVLVQSGGKLERTDCIKEVLKDSDFVHILGESNNYFVFLPFIVRKPPNSCRKLIAREIPSVWIR